MKIKMKLVLGVSLLMLIFVFSGLVMAQSGDEPGTDAEPLMTTTQAPETEQPKDLQGRLEQRKQKLRIRLTNFEKNRLTARCKSAQGLLKSAEGRIKGVETGRKQLYDNLLAKLKAVADRLEQEGVETGFARTLNSHISIVEQRTQTLHDNIASYHQAVADLAAMDCAADPEGFKAALLEARDLAKRLRLSDKDIREYFKKQIKATLQSLRVELTEPAENTIQETQGE